MLRHWYTNWSRHQDDRIIKKRLFTLEATWPHFWEPIYANFKERRHLHGLAKTPVVSFRQWRRKREDDFYRYRFKRAKHERNARQWQAVGWDIERVA